MATVKHVISEHDVVFLREPVGTWPTGTVGAVISAYDDTLLVEITVPGGKTVNTIQVPAGQLDASTPESADRSRMTAFAHAHPPEVPES